VALVEALHKAALTVHVLPLQLLLPHPGHTNKNNL
jgi:hypothetical protein